MSGPGLKLNGGQSPVQLLTEGQRELAPAAGSRLKAGMNWHPGGSRLKAGMSWHLHRLH